MPVTHPKVTVLMSVFNDQGYLADAVRSILRQTFTDFEFLIIDDGSLVPVEQLMSTYADERIVVLRQTNVGLTRSLNRGLRMCSGQYVARMDADDVSFPERLESQVRELDSDSNLDLVGSFFDMIDGRGGLLETKELIIDPMYRLWRLQFHNTYGHGTVMMRKTAVIDAGLYDEGLRYAQDYDLWSRLSSKSNTKIIPKVLYRYRLEQTGPQASVRNYDAQLAAAIRISDKNLRKCNPGLTTDQCEDVRALYWKFQRPEVSPNGLEAVPEILDGFCGRYGIEDRDKAKLIQRVHRDVVDEIREHSQLPATHKQSAPRS